MRKLVVSEFITLDGVIESPQDWSFPYWNDEIASFKLDEIRACGGLVLGRVTYEGFAQAWPGRTDEQGYADRINSLPKYVVSSTLPAAEWQNSTLIRGGLAAEIARLKQQPGGDLVLFGSGMLARGLAGLNLVDEYHLLVYPVAPGKGRRLFEGSARASLALLDVKRYSSGVVLLKYQVIHPS